MENSTPPNQDQTPKTTPISAPSASRNRLSIIFAILFLLALGSTAFLFYQNQQLTSKLPKYQQTQSSQSLTPTVTTDKTATTSAYDLVLTGLFYVGPKQFQLFYMPGNISSTSKIPETGKYIVKSTFPTPEQYILLEEPYNACGIPTITMNDFSNITGQYNNVVRILAQYNCGDSTNRKVMGIATDKTDSKWIVLPTYTIDGIDTYLERYYKTVGWDSPDTIIMNEINLDKTTGQKTSERFVRINIMPPNTITSIK